jgi:hypothetical protein
MTRASAQLPFPDRNLTLWVFLPVIVGVGVFRDERIVGLYSAACASTEKQP